MFCTILLSSPPFSSQHQSEGQSNAPGFVNERKVDHLTIVLEVCNANLPSKTAAHMYLSPALYALV